MLLAECKRIFEIIVLEPVFGNSGDHMINLRLIVYEHLKHRTFSVDVERLEICRLRGIGHGEIFDAEVWVIDDFATSLVNKVSTNSSDLAIEESVQILNQRLFGTDERA